MQNTKFLKKLGFYFINWFLVKKSLVARLTLSSGRPYKVTFPGSKLGLGLDDDIGEFRIIVAMAAGSSSRYFIAAVFSIRLYSEVECPFSSGLFGLSM